MQNSKQNTFKIVLTGPESSGKSSMSEALARNFKTNWVPEFARYYLAQLGRAYEQADLMAIGKGQQAWEIWHGYQAKDLYFCDTDWTVLQIWEAYRYSRPSTGGWHWEKGYKNPQIADLYLLCKPDFPWQPDPLRENPSDRSILFEQYEKLLNQSEANFFILSGTPAQRLEAAISQVAKLFSTLQ